MDKIVVEGALLVSSPTGVVTVDNYDTDLLFWADGKKCCREISFTVVLATGHEGSGSIVANSLFVEGGGENYILATATANVVCTLEGANPPTVPAVISIANAGQENVYAD